MLSYHIWNDDDGGEGAEKGETEVGKEDAEWEKEGGGGEN